MKADNVNKILDEVINYEKSIQKRKRETAFRMFVEENEDINIINYWFYRFFTRRFENWLIEKFIK